MIRSVPRPHAEHHGGSRGGTPAHQPPAQGCAPHGPLVHIVQLGGDQGEGLHLQAHPIQQFPVGRIGLQPVGYRSTLPGG